MKHLAAGIRVAFGLGHRTGTADARGRTARDREPGGDRAGDQPGLRRRRQRRTRRTTHDYVELFNPTTAPISLNGWSIQYASATGTGNFGANGDAAHGAAERVDPGRQVLPRPGGERRAAGSRLPAPDLTDATPIAMAAGAGKVALANIAHVARLQRQLDAVQRDATRPDRRPRRLRNRRQRRELLRGRRPGADDQRDARPTSAATTAAPTPTTTAPTSRPRLPAPRNTRDARTTVCAATPSSLSINDVSHERGQRGHDDVHLHGQPLVAGEDRRRDLRHRDRRRQRNRRRAATTWRSR